MRTASMENSEVCQVEVVVTPVMGTTGPAESELCGLLRQTIASSLILTAHPRTLITLSVYVQAEDGGVCALAVNAAMLALVNAGVPMRTLMGAVTLGLFRGVGEGSSSSSSSSSSELLVDVTAAEEREAHSLALAVYTAEEVGGGGSPTALILRGSFSEQQLRDAIETTKAAAVTVLKCSRAALREEVLKDAQTSFSSTLSTKLTLGEDREMT